MRRKSPGPRLEDVARRAGVHPSTVSRFFGRPSLVSARTAARIRSAVEELSYMPDLLAGSLASSKRRLAALLVPNLAYSNYNEAIEQIASGLTAGGTNVMLGITEGATERCDQLVMAALRWRVDAVIAWTPLSLTGARLLRDNGVTVVEICDASVEPVDIGIGFNEGEAGRALARLVHARGYRLPFFVGTRGPFSILRRNAFRAEWQALAGALPDEALIDPPANFHHGRGIFALIRARVVQPDVVLSPSDHLAQALIVEAQAAGLAVPGDLAIFGFGNTPLAADMRPPISSVDLHHQRIPTEILAVLDTRAKGGTVAARHIDLGFAIVERESSWSCSGPD